MFKFITVTYISRLWSSGTCSHGTWVSTFSETPYISEYGDRRLLPPRLCGINTKYTILLTTWLQPITNNIL